MSQPHSTESSIANPGPYQTLVVAAAFVVVTAGLKAASSLLLPIVLAGFLSLITWPLVQRMERVKVPRGLAVLLVVIVSITSLLLVLAVLAGAVAAFTAKLPGYIVGLEMRLAGLETLLIDLGVPERSADLSGVLDSSAVLGLAAPLVGGIGQLLGRLVIVALIQGFLLLEWAILGDKLRSAITDREALASLAGFASAVQRYLYIKTILSVVTGVLLGALLSALGIPYAVLWGFLVFLLNFIPSIGSIVATVPPALLALLEIGPGMTVVVVTLFLTVNITIGNVIEPRLMGRRLGLSPAALLISLLFWGYVWGPIGMVLAAPVSVVIKNLAALRPETRAIAILLGPPGTAIPVVVAGELQGAESEMRGAEAEEGAA